MRDDNRYQFAYLSSEATKSVAADAAAVGSATTGTTTEGGAEGGAEDAEGEDVVSEGESSTVGADFLVFFFFFLSPFLAFSAGGETAGGMSRSGRGSSETRSGGLVGSAQA